MVLFTSNNSQAQFKISSNTCCRCLLWLLFKYLDHDLKAVISTVVVMVFFLYLATGAFLQPQGAAEVRLNIQEIMP